MLQNVTKLSVHLTPGAKRNEIFGFAGDVLKVKIAAPPREGKANVGLVAFLSEELGVSKSSITLVRGHTSRNKVIEITGLSLDDIRRKVGSS